MAMFGRILAQKFSSEKPPSGSKLFAGAFGDLMRKTMPTDTPSTKPPATSEKKNNEWLYDEERGVYFKYFWKDGVPKKMLKVMPWMHLDWTIS
jgi:hypothetical protein